MIDAFMQTQYFHYGYSAEVINRLAGGHSLPSGKHITSDCSLPVTTLK